MAETALYRPIALFVFLTNAQWLAGKASIQRKSKQFFINLIGAKVMPDFCCAPDSSNGRIPGYDLGFNKKPSGDLEKEKDPRLKWLNPIHKDKWFEDEVRNV